MAHKEIAKLGTRKQNYWQNSPSPRSQLMRPFTVLAMAGLLVGCSNKTEVQQGNGIDPGFSQRIDAAHKEKPDLARAVRQLPPPSERDRYQRLTAEEWGKRLFDRDDSMSREATAALSQIGPQGALFLLEGMRSDVPHVASYSLGALAWSRLTPQQEEEVIAYAAGVARNAQSPVRHPAILVLLHRGDKSKQAMPILLGILDENADGAAHAAAVEAIARIDEQQAALSLAKYAAKPGLSKHVLATLSQLGPKATGAVPTLQGILESQPQDQAGRDDNPLSDGIARTVAAIDGDKSVPFLVKAVKTRKGWRGALQALGNMGDRAKTAIPDLKAIRDDRYDAINDALLKIEG